MSLRYVNCSVRDIIQKWENGIRTPEVTILYNDIENYKIDLEKRVKICLDEMHAAMPDNRMKWIQENSPADIRQYLFCEVQGCGYDVLMRSKTKWKTLADIGLDVEDSDQQNDSAALWEEEWNRQAQNLASIKLPIFESHAHYNLPVFDEYRDKLMDLMHGSGIARIVIPAIDYPTNAQMVELFDRPEYPYVYFAFGSHPKYILKDDEWPEEKEAEFIAFLENKKCVAIGEAGLDYSAAWLDEELCLKQKNVFIKLIEIANESSLPMILHIRPNEGCNCTRDVNEDALKILYENRIENGAVLHCFGGSYDDVLKYMRVGVTAFGIGGRIIYGDAALEDAVCRMPEEAILLETDAPYIKLDSSKMPNTSLSLIDIASKVARIRDTDVEHILKVTYENAMRLFFVDSIYYFSIL